MTEIISIIQDVGGYLIWPISFVLLILILLQGGAGDISSAFGGGGQLDSSLGVGAQQKISKVTGWFVAAFLIIVVMMSIPVTGGALNVPSKVADETALESAVTDISTEAAGDAAASTPETTPDAGAVNPDVAAPPDAVVPAPVEPAQENGAAVEVIEDAAKPAEAGAGAAEIEVVE